MFDNTATSLNCALMEISYTFAEKLHLIDTPREQRGNHDVLPLGNELYDLVTKC